MQAVMVDSAELSIVRARIRERYGNVDLAGILHVKDWLCADHKLTQQQAWDMPIGTLATLLGKNASMEGEHESQDEEVDHTALATNGYFHVHDDVVWYRTSSGWEKYRFGPAMMRLFESVTGKQEIGFAEFMRAFGRSEEQYHPYQQDVNQLLASKDACFHFRANKREDRIYIVDSPFTKKSPPKRARTNASKSNPES